MAEIRVNIVMPKLEPLLDATEAVAVKWEEMTYCYGGSEENSQLAELLDDLLTACREFRKAN